MIFSKNTPTVFCIHKKKFPRNRHILSDGRGKWSNNQLKCTESTMKPQLKTKKVVGPCKISKMYSPFDEPENIFRRGLAFSV